MILGVGSLNDVDKEKVCVRVIGGDVTQEDRLLLEGAGPQGGCAAAGAFVAGGGSVSACRVTLGGDTRTVLTGAVGVGLRGGTAGGGAFYTDAENFGQLSGESACLSGGVTAGGVGSSATVCSGSGATSVIVSGEAMLTPVPLGPQGSATVTGSLVINADPAGSLGGWLSDRWKEIWAPFAPGGSL